MSQLLCNKYVEHGKSTFTWWNCVALFILSNLVAEYLLCWRMNTCYANASTVISFFPLVFYSLLHNGVVSCQKMSQRCQRVRGSWSSTQCRGRTAPTCCFSLAIPSFKTPHLCFTVSFVLDACPVCVCNNLIKPSQTSITQPLISYKHSSCLVNILQYQSLSTQLSPIFAGYWSPFMLQLVVAVSCQCLFA